MELGYRVLRADTDVYFAEVRLRSSPLILFTLCFILCRSAPPAIDSKRRMVPGLAHLSLACPGVIGAVLLVAAVALAISAGLTGACQSVVDRDALMYQVRGCE